MIVGLVQASIDVNRRSLAKEPDVLSGGEQRHMMGMIAGTGGAMCAPITH